MKNLNETEQTSQLPTGETARTTQDFDLAFKNLLLAWNEHQELRASNPVSATLWESRGRLDERRLAANTARSSMLV